jgi:hypothetical protein
MEINLNEFQKTIETIISEGFVIVQIITNENSVLYFSAYEFTPSFRSSVDDVQYCSLIGINITDFMNNNANQVDSRLVIERFRQVIQKNPVIRVEFFGSRWFKWASSSKQYGTK